MSPSLVIAPDSFKGSLAALDVAAALAEGWRSVRPDDDITLLPQADGGEGTLDAIEAAVPEAIRHEVGPVSGPDGKPTSGVWLELPGRIAVVELAQMSGLPMMDTLDPLGASTYGLGEVIRAAVESGAQRVVIGLGGSASTDGGAGALAALGLRQADGSELPLGGAALRTIGGLDRSDLLAAPAGGVVLLSDVDAPLLGPSGAAAVFGPQKGATPQQVEQLDAALTHFASLLGDGAEVPGSGAAGGAGYGFIAAWGAEVEPGADYLAELSGLPGAIASADLLLTGEGRFDATSGTGKLVGQLIGLAERHDARIGIVAGQVTAQPVSSDGTPLWSAALVDLAGSVGAAIAEPARWLREAGAAAARALGE
ncbi:glycerate kinase [Glaciihabitans sp. UYNi722]|uniref:glycerate kinase family protein n=1 Tax=Glaciihabitans sp. UYNi722 TaxID=3156344 RepID=UPI0033957FCA